MPRWSAGTRAMLDACSSQLEVSQRRAMRAMVRDTATYRRLHSAATGSASAKQVREQVCLAAEMNACICTRPTAGSGVSACSCRHGAHTLTGSATKPQHRCIIVNMHSTVFECVVCHLKATVLLHLNRRLAACSSCLQADNPVASADVRSQGTKRLQHRTSRQQGVDVSCSDAWWWPRGRSRQFDCLEFGQAYRCEHRPRSCLKRVAANCDGCEGIQRPRFFGSAVLTIALNAGRCSMHIGLGRCSPGVELSAGVSSQYRMSCMHVQSDLASA